LRNFYVNVLISCDKRLKINDKFLIGQKTITNLIKKLTEKGDSAEIVKNFKPLIYSIWNTPKGDDVSHFGEFPA